MPVLAETFLVTANAGKDSEGHIASAPALFAPMAAASLTWRCAAVPMNAHGRDALDQLSQVMWQGISAGALDDDDA